MLLVHGSNNRTTTNNTDRLKTVRKQRVSGFFMSLTVMILTASSTGNTRNIVPHLDKIENTNTKKSRSKEEKFQRRNLWIRRASFDTPFSPRISPSRCFSFVSSFVFFVLCWGEMKCLEKGWQRSAHLRTKTESAHRIYWRAIVVLWGWANLSRRNLIWNKKIFFRLIME